MAATIIDGRAVAAAIREDVAARATALRARHIVPKCIAVVAKGDAPGLLYAQTARHGGAPIGVDVEIVPIGAGADTSGALAIVARVVEEPSAHGVIIQRPLPPRVAEAQVVNAMDRRKDVDCCHPTTFGLLALGRPTFAPATALAVMELLRATGSPLAGARVTVVGRSPIVGRPVALLLTAADATVTLCHSKTADLADECRRADAIVVAVGKAGFLTADMVKPGLPVMNADGTPKWRMAPSPHGAYWKEGMKLGYQDVGSLTLLKSTPMDRRKAAWLYQQFIVSKTVSLKKSHVGLTFIRESDIWDKSFTDRAPKLGGLIEFYRSPARVQWTPTGNNVPDYPKLAQLWWQNIGDASSGAKTPQAAMDSLAAAQDSVMERLEKSGVQGACGPKMNKKETAEHWFAKSAKDGNIAPQRKLANEKPKGETIDYDTLIKSWPATPPKRASLN